MMDFFKGVDGVIKILYLNLNTILVMRTLIKFLYFFKKGLIKLF